MTIRLLKSTSPRARRDHRCLDCDLLITNGAIYRRDLLADDESIYDWCSHPECHEEACRHWDPIDEDGWPTGYLVSYVDRADWSPEYAAWYDSTRQNQTHSILEVTP